MAPKSPLGNRFPTASPQTRAASPQVACFVALRGTRVDGHDFISGAIASGAAAIVCEDDAHLQPEERAHCILVKSSLLFIQELGRAWRLQLTTTTVIGITGSSGKTTAKELLSYRLQKIGPCSYTQGNFNNELGVPLTLCQIRKSDQFAIVEMGARHPGNIKDLCRLVDPDLGILLNIGSAHVGEFGSLQNLRSCKQELFSTTRQSMIAVCLAEDEDTVAVARQFHSKVVTFGYSDRADVKISRTNYSKGALVVDLQAKDQPQQSLQFPIPHEVYGIHLAIVVASAAALGFSEAVEPEFYHEFRSIPGRFFQTDLANFSIIDDSYNANPESMAAGLRSITAAFAGKSKALVLGDMLELGTLSKDQHASLGKLCAELNPELLITVGREAEEIGKSATTAGFQAGRYAHFDRVEGLIRHSADQNWPEVIFVKGSRSIGLDQFVQHLQTTES